MKLTLGIDFGSASVRALVLVPATGEVLATENQNYSQGIGGVITSKENPHMARQCPDDYLESMDIAVRGALKQIVALGYKAEDIDGIGVDATGSTPLPVAKNGEPMSRQANFKDNVNALAWMWKDHTSFREAELITDIAKQDHPQYLENIGGAYSSEWFWSKLLHCEQIDKELFDAAYTWVELSDYVPAVLSGVSDANDIKRNRCAAAHKALYSSMWGGFAQTDFLSKLSEGLVRIRETLPQHTFPVDQTAGCLSTEWSTKWGLKEGTPIAMGILDAHAGAIGSGVCQGSLIKIIGTSSCDLAIQKSEDVKNAIEGIAGVAEESVLPGYFGIEAGQSAVGDILNWFVTKVAKGASHNELTAAAATMSAGESGLLALDWNNGNRNVLTDPLLSGLIIGQTLHTNDAEIYRTLIESTAFGAKRIIEQLEKGGVVIDEVVCCGGISQKNALFMQIYADIINKPMKVVDTQETVALGAAMIGAMVASKAEGAELDQDELRTKCCKTRNKEFVPQKSEQKAYEKLYELYKQLHDGFGRKGEAIDMFNVMKELLLIKSKEI